MSVYQVVNTCLDVFYAVDSKFAIIQIHKLLAETRRSADIGREHPDSLRQQRLIIAAEWCPFLSFRSAMEADDIRSWSILILGFVQPAAQLQSIKRFESHQLRPDQRCHVNSGMWTECKLAELFGLHVHDPDVGRLRCARNVH